jgi:hypothetical protein
MNPEAVKCLLHFLGRIFARTQKGQIVGSDREPRLTIGKMSAKA